MVSLVDTSSPFTKRLRSRNRLRVAFRYLLMAPSSDSSVRKARGWRLNQLFPMARPETVAVVLHLMIARERLPSYFLPHQLLSILLSKTVTDNIQVDHV